METDLKELGQKIRKARLDRNLTQQGLGMMVGVGYSSISLWESGERQPSVPQLLKICKSLKLSADDLLGLELSPIKHSKMGLKWFSQIPEPLSINYNERVLSGIDYFKMIVDEGYGFQSIQERYVNQRNLSQNQIIHCINAAFLSRSISIFDVDRDSETEATLKEKYGLQQCIISKLDGLPQSSNIVEPIRAEAIAFLAVKYCLPFIGGLRSVGFSGGSPIARFFDLIPPYSPELTGITWFSLLSTERHPSMVPMANTANGILARLLFNQPQTHGFSMPFINIERRSKDYLNESSRHEKRELEHALYVQRNASQVDMAIASVGSPDFDYKFMEKGLVHPDFSRVFFGLSEEDKEKCVGDLLLRLLDKHGNRIGSEDDKYRNEALVFSVDLDDFKELVKLKKQVWILGARREKSNIIRALLDSKMANCIIIDNRIAKNLLESS